MSINLKGKTSRIRIRDYLWTTIFSIVIGIGISIIGDIPAVFAILVLFLCWPVSDVIIDKIADSNPDYHNTIVRRSWIFPISTILVWFMGGFIIYGFHWFGDIPFGQSLSISIIVTSITGAVLGITAELEDRNYSK